MDINQLPIVINESDEISNKILILDSQGNKYSKLLSYNRITKEAKMYETLEDGSVKTKWKNQDNKSLHKRFNGDIAGRELIIKNEILEDSFIKFKLT